MNTTKLVSPALLLLALTLPVLAEDTPPAPGPVPSPAPPAEVTPAGRFSLEFRGARLGQVLDYLSKEAGYVIANPVELAAPITLIAKQPLTADEAVEALNGVLIDLGYAAIVRGRTLHVVTLPTARQQNLPVSLGSDPERIPDTDRMVTQILPVQFAIAKDLADNLQPLLNTTSATLAANEAANVLILTDTQSHVRRIAAIIHSIDGSVGGEMQVRVFHLTHADAEPIATIINTIYGKSSSTNNRNSNAGLPPFMSMFNGGGRNGGATPNNGGSQSSSSGRGVDVTAAADTGTNSIVVRAAPATLLALGEMITQLDVDTTAHEDVLVYKVRNGKAVDLAASLSNLFQNSGTTTGSSTSTTNQQRNTNQTRANNTTPTATSSDPNALDLSGQVRVVADTTSNSVLVLSLERNFERIRKMLADLDQPMRQVLVRVLMAEVTSGKDLDLGIELSGGHPASSTTQTRAFSNFGTFDSTLGSTLGMNGFLLNSDEFQVALRALATDTRFDVLSRPYILTTDNQQAVVNVSENVPIINGTRTDTNNNVTTTFDRQDVGIILTVTPQINSDGRVLLDVNQVISALTDQSIVVGANVSSPVIKKRTMTTRVAVDSGQTVVVGGLVHDSITEMVSKVPLLGDIPLLGALFRRTKNTKTKTELLLFLTPQVITNASEMTQMSNQLRGEMDHIDAAVEKGTLQRHLDQLSHLKVGQPVPPAASPETHPVTPTENGGK